MAPETEEYFCDDADEQYFQARLKLWLASLPAAEAQETHISLETFDRPLAEQWSLLSFPPLVEVGPAGGVGGYRIPAMIWERLLEYQREGVNWMLDLHRQEVGGILGDEMGLGKTIQVVSFVAALHVSERVTAGPVLVVCPATVMRQWVKEFHAWWPPLRITLLHSSGSRGDSLPSALRTATTKGHVIVTSYGHLQHPEIGRKILQGDYAAVILDEGHKIRNPLTDISILCKHLRTAHRYILSGTPIQNNLIELWSLMDFVFPGRLGSLTVFKAEIAQPISAGGYVSASSLQVQTSYRCACILKDLVAPYLLRRIKADVAQSLPAKREQVLFCQLTQYQRQLYEHYISSEDVRAILAGEKNILAGIDILRKICNHPALLKAEDEEIYGLTHIEPPTDPTERSGKMNVLQSVLRHWHGGAHRVLLFCQTRQMLDIVEAFVRGQAYRYFRMDGTTPVAARMALVDQFNRDGAIFVFLLTTKVGGLGINLTGADRVLIYDPDWNPSTDMQARERAWRLGQSRPVTIYRMLTVGTIEEKIYHRQIFKQYLTNRILADPKQTRFFKSSELYDLFSLAGQDELETRDLLHGLEEGAGSGADRAEHSSPTGVSQADRTSRNILEGLLQVSGLHSALEHDRLVERPRREVMLVEREARRRAADAIEALRKSRAERHRAPERSGHGGGLSAGLTSSAILASIRRRQLAATAPVDGSSTTATVPVVSPGGQEPLQRVVDQLLKLFQEHRNCCTSATIATTFAHIAGEEAVAFRQVLRTLATLDETRRTWRLKAEFANALQPQP